MRDLQTVLFGTLHPFTEDHQREHDQDDRIDMIGSAPEPVQHDALYESQAITNVIGTEEDEGEYGKPKGP
jgi:hypothetical protein